MDLAHQNPERSQASQKAWYEKHAEEKPLNTGYLVLVLFPVRKNKMEGCCEGPFEVVERVNEVFMIDQSERTSLWELGAGRLLPFPVLTTQRSCRSSPGLATQRSCWSSPAPTTQKSRWSHPGPPFRRSCWTCHPALAVTNPCTWTRWRTTPESSLLLCRALKGTSFKSKSKNHSSRHICKALSQKHQNINRKASEDWSTSWNMSCLLDLGRFFIWWSQRVEGSPKGHSFRSPRNNTQKHDC
ncbi:uncharacterized protein LOC123361765 [Mauremys mutica]|uniref:uncharacterized protein LOC123361765 n=1 Tax=Mauremys mutica TaxID=74926 RepID=UPI001D15AA91|nr:uncharacterized protein LOC123361765 [Mauremys mutica]